MTPIWDVVVVGLGLFGSAAVRHLANAGADVIGIGPGEPADPATHEGVFASHYDSGRITRRIDPDPIWQTLSRRAIDEYPTIAETGGVDFHRPVGLLWVDPGGARTQVWMERADRGEIEGGVGPYGIHAERFPFLSFPDGMWSAFEPAPAGHIDPRRMLEAQHRAAQGAGATLLDDVVISRVGDGKQHTLVTARSGSVTAKHVVVATGAYAGKDTLLPVPLPLRVKSETIVLARVGEDAAARLSTMPSVIYGIIDEHLDDVYVVPPVRYPDGRWYVKMGANTSADLALSDEPAMRRWMQNGATTVQATALSRAITAMFPGIAFEAFVPKRCLITYTPSGRPFVDQVESGLYVATAGNGVGAKSSDAVGAMAAAFVMAGTWVDVLPQEHFVIPASP